MRKGVWNWGGEKEHFHFSSFLSFWKQTSLETGSSCGQCLPSPRGSDALFQDVVRKSGVYCWALECYTGFIAWLNYMWFPFSECGAGPTDHGEWKGARVAKKLVSPPVHLRVVSTITITVVEISKSSCGQMKQLIHKILSNLIHIA